MLEELSREELADLVVQAALVVLEVRVDQVELVEPLVSVAAAAVVAQERSLMVKG